MKSIKSQLITYFICLGVSFIVGWMNIMSQPVAFFATQVVGVLFIILVESVKVRCNFVEALCSILVVEFIACVGMLPSFIIAWIFILMASLYLKYIVLLLFFFLMGRKNVSLLSLTE